MIEQHKSLTEKFLKKGFWLYLFSFIIEPIWYIIKIIISSKISVSEVWILYWVISLMTILSAFNDFGMTESMNKFIPKYVTEKRYDKVKSILIYAFLMQFITWLIIASFFYFWADFIWENYFKSTIASWILKIFAFFFLWINIFQIISTFFISIQNTFLAKIIEFFRMIFILFSIILIFVLDLSNLNNFSYSWIIWLYIWIIIALYLFYKNYYKNYLKNEKIIWSKSFFKKIFNYAIIVFIWAQAATILWQIDMQMIIYLLWTEKAWYYTNYLSIISIPFMVVWPMFWLLFPVFSEMHSKWDISKIKLAKTIFKKNFLAIWIAFNILFFVFASKIAIILFWVKFMESWLILQYSILFLVFNFLLQINFSIMAAIWKVKERLYIVLIAIIFNFILNLILINLIWAYWAALATWIWWILIRILSEISLWKIYKAKNDYIFLFKNTILMSIIWLLSNIYVLPLFVWKTRLEMLFYMFGIWIIWFIIFWLINILEFKTFVIEVKKLKKW